MAQGALIPYFQFLFGKMLDALNSGNDIVNAVNTVATEFGYMAAIAFCCATLQGKCNCDNGAGLL
jgi:hypothetical protein